MRIKWQSPEVLFSVKPRVYIYTTTFSRPGAGGPILKIQEVNQSPHHLIATLLIMHKDEANRVTSGRFIISLRKLF